MLAALRYGTVRVLQFIRYLVVASYIESNIWPIKSYFNSFDPWTHLSKVQLPGEMYDSDQLISDTRITTTIYKAAGYTFLTV